MNGGDETRSGYGVRRLCRRFCCEPEARYAQFQSGGRATALQRHNAHRPRARSRRRSWQSSAAQEMTTPREDDESYLRSLGYGQQLFREMGGFSNFAISFSIISIL